MQIMTVILILNFELSVQEAMDAIFPKLFVHLLNVLALCAQRSGCVVG